MMQPLERDKVDYTGLRRLIASSAVTIGTLTGPILKRLAPVIFVVAVVTAIVFVWAVAEFINPLVPWFVRDVIAVAAALGFICVVAIVGIWAERKVAGHIQSRIGPMRTGGWHGWSQSFADGLKLVAKEDLIPASADRIMFRLAPYIALVPVICAYVAIPFGFAWVFRDLDVSLLLVLGLLGIEVLAVILAGWASNSKWSLLGGMREACQLVSYEIPMALSLLTVVVVSGSLSLRQIGQAQADGWFQWLMFANPFTFLACFTYFIASLASCKRAPFDLPEAESELVAGFHTEYSGFRFAMFFFAEYCGMFVVSALATILFLGGWSSPFGPIDLQLAGRTIELADSPLWFVGKSTSLIFLQMWLRWTLPRIRIDQVMHACMKYLLPLTMAVFVGASVWQVKMIDYPAASQKISFILGIIGLIIVISCAWLLAHGMLYRRRMVGRLGRKLLPGA